MNQIIAAYYCNTQEIPQACVNVFSLGVEIIEREYKTSINCNMNHNKQDNKAELTILNFPQQDWFTDLDLRETIVYKLSTHFKICLEHFITDNENKLEIA